MQDSTRLDATIMAGLVAKAVAVKSAPSLDGVRVMAPAFEQGKVPERGTVDKRTVQAAFSLLLKAAAPVAATVENPLPAPHNLSWYFRTCTAPQDIRNFATRLSANDVRVWSVARASDTEWKVLVQVSDAESKNAAVSIVAGASLRPSGALKRHIVANVVAVATPSGVVPSSFPRLAPIDGSDGTFVELTLAE